MKVKKVKKDRNKQILLLGFLVGGKTENPSFGQEKIKCSREANADLCPKSEGKCGGGELLCQDLEARLHIHGGGRPIHQRAPRGLSLIPHNDSSLSATSRTDNVPCLPPHPPPHPPSSSIRYLFSSFSARFWRPTGVAPPPELLCNLARGVVCAINYSPKCALCYMDDYTHVAQDNKFRKPLYRIVAQQPRARLSLPSLPCLLLCLPTPRCSSAQQPSPTHPLKPTTRQQTRWFQLLYIFLIVGFSVGGESSLLLLLSSKQASPRAGCCSRILPPPSSSPTFTQKRDFGGGGGGRGWRWVSQYIQ